MNDDGALEAFTAVLIALLLMTMLMFASAFALVNQYQRARTAADLAAVGAVGLADQCEVAAAAVERNGARMIDCKPTASDLAITVAVPTGIRGLGLPTTLEVSARASTPHIAATETPPTVRP